MPYCVEYKLLRVLQRTIDPTPYAVHFFYSVIYYTGCVVFTTNLRRPRVRSLHLKRAVMYSVPWLTLRNVENEWWRAGGCVLHPPVRKPVILVNQGGLTRNVIFSRRHRILFIQDKTVCDLNLAQLQLPVGGRLQHLLSSCLHHPICLTASQPGHYMVNSYNGPILDAVQSLSVATFDHMLS